MALLVVIIEYSKDGDIENWLTSSIEASMSPKATTSAIADIQVTRRMD